MLLVLGFPPYFLNFFLFFLLPLLSGLYVRRKWRRAVARKREVQRLLLLASQETALAELETSYSLYSLSSLPPQRDYVDSYRETVPAPKAQLPVQNQTVPFHCAVCYIPTKKLCARCKSVRYCSGKCQITHWREGHKEECLPCATTQQNIDEGNTSSWEAEKKGHGSYNYGFETEGTHDACAFSDMGPSSEILSMKDDKSKEEYHGDFKAPSPASNSSSTIFSESSPVASSGSSDEVSSSESIDSCELGETDGQNLAEISPNKPEYSVNVKVVDQAEPLISDVSVSENVVNSFTSRGKLQEIKPILGATAQQGSTSSSDLNIKNSGASVPKHSSTGNDFWNEALDYSWATKGSTKSNSHEFADGKLSDSRSSLHFSFSMAQNTSEVTAHVSDGPHPDSSRIYKSDRGTLEEMVMGTTQKGAKLIPLSSEESKVTKNDNGISSSDMSGSKGGKSCTSNPVSVSCTSINSVRSSHVLTTSDIVSNKSRSRENGSSSSNSAVTHLSLHNGEQSASSVKGAKVDDAHSNGFIPSYTGGLPHISNNGFKTSMRKVVDQLRAAKQLSKPCTLAAGSESSLSSTNKGLFPYELFIKLYMWNKVELQPCGLINCGNSCYANVVLQCLAFTPPLTAYFLQGFHRESCTKKDWCFSCEFESLILKAKEGNSPVSPIGIISRLRSIGSHLSNGREEDAHEFLRCVVDTMQSECVKESRNDLTTSLQEETSLIGLTLGGYLRSKIKCLKCEGKSERHERIMDLTVEIEGDIGTLDDALSRFTRTEILDGENKYECSRCKIHQKAKKKLTILEAPNVLTIALKRFQSGKFGKLNKSIEFPEILNLVKYMSSSSDKSPVYRLYGVVEHVDIMNSAFSGHYVCYVKNIQNKWFKIDDTVVKPVEIKKVKEKAAYMLLYARCSPRAPKSLRSKASHDSILKIPASIPTAISSDLESYRTRHHAMQTIYETESSSSSEGSLFSSCSDEGSWSTESSARDSATSVDDLLELRYGGAGSPWQNSSDSDSPSSSSSCSPVNSNQPGGDGWNKEGKRGTQFLHSDSGKLCRNNNSSNEMARIGVSGVKYDVSSRTRSMREKSGLHVVL